MPAPAGKAPQENVIRQWLQRLRGLLSERLLEAGQQAGPPDGVAYNVTFTGRFTLPEEQAVAQVAAFFKLGQTNTRRLLQADRILKSYPDKAPADRLAAMLARMGAQCRVELEVPTTRDEPGTVQKVAFALEAVQIPEFHLPDYHRFGRRTWAGLAGLGLAAVALAVWLVLRPPVIGGDSQADYEASIDRVAMTGDSEHARKVYRAVEMLTAAARHAQRDSATTDPDTAARLVYAAVAGKTAPEIIALAEARLEKQREAYRQGLADNTLKIEAVNAQLAAIAPDNAVVLSKIAIEDAAFGWPAGASGPTIAFTVRNNSAVPVSRVFLQGYLYDANGALLASHPLTYAVSGSIAPGLSASIGLPMRSDSPWAVQKARKLHGLILKLRVANAENSEGKALGIDYRPLEAERQRHLDWQEKTRKELDAIKL